VAENAFLLETLKQLVEIPSVTGQEQQVGEYIITALWACGMDTVSRQDIGGGRFNVIAKIKGARPGPTILMTGHMDTVGVGDGWSTDPFQAVVKNGKMYGRGAADMKCGIAAVLDSLRIVAMRREDLCGEILVAFVCDEEAYSAGVDHLIRRGIHADFGIAAEPEWKAIIGAVGKMLIKVKVQGIAAHGNRPDLGINAIEEGSKFLAAIDKLEVLEHPRLGRQEYVTLKIEGGFKEYAIVIPEYCEFLINKHTVPEETKEFVIAGMENLVKRLGLRAKFTFEVQPPYYPAFDLGDQIPWFDQLKEIFHEVTGEELRTDYSTGVSDNNRLVPDAGIPMICLGPKGNGVHQKDEWVDLKSVEQISKVYQKFLLLEKKI